MQRIKGVTLRAEIRNGAALSPTRMRCASEVLADTLAELHGVDVAKAGLLEIGRGQNYLPRQVQAWGNRYEKARTESSPDLDDLTAWLLTRIPKRSETTLVHNDYKYDNVFLDASTFGTVVAIIDWERATLGDPVLDLGIALGSWVQGDDPPEFRALQEGPTYLPGSLTRTEFAQRYAERSRRRIDHLHYCFVFALYQRAVAAQQRLAKVLATPEPGVDPRAVNHQVKILARLAAKSAISGRVDQLAL
jgi:aminoglycoside phosphotransferase (APT) family kinase protein